MCGRAEEVAVAAAGRRHCVRVVLAVFVAVVPVVAVADERLALAVAVGVEPA